jgi:hypothetical protein
MRLSFASSILGGAIIAALATTPVAAQTFGSSTPDNGIAPFGRDAGFDAVTAAVAETFVAPTGSPLLQSFTFFLQDFIGGPDLQLQSNVFLFSGDHVVGPALYSSAIRAGSGNSAGYDPFAFSNVNVLLAPGTMYALVLRAAGTSPDGSTNTVGTTTGDSFALGQLFMSTGSSDAQLSTPGAFTASNANSFGSDAALRVTFGPNAVTATPEPASLVLFGSGLAGLGAMVRRRRTHVG